MVKRYIVSRGTMKKILINATQSEEMRVALVDGQYLYDLYIETPVKQQQKSNIYKGKVVRIEPSLEAAFVDFGSNRNGFLALKEIAPQYYPSNCGDSPSIQDILTENQPLIVQVNKEERGNKGAALSTFISLAGRYLVLMPNNPKAGGISRRIEGDERDLIKQTLNSLKIPDSMGVIVRTAGLGRKASDLQWDLDYLIQLCQAIERADEECSEPALIYQENNLVVRAIRDYLRNDIDEVVIDTKEAFEEAIKFIDQVMPHYRNRLKHYKDKTPLFSHYKLEEQIKTAFSREVELPSRGSIVIDPTEALVSIDINSARSTKGADIEETALNTNLEAISEIARQLKLRDTGGLIVIDFIDMADPKNQTKIEEEVRRAFEHDRARVKFGKLSPFGLLEMSRQRLKSSLEETTTLPCPRCNGTGSILTIHSFSLYILRILEDKAIKQPQSTIHAFLPIPVATFLLNEKKDNISRIAENTNSRILLIPSSDFETPHYDIQQIKTRPQDLQKPSYIIPEKSSNTQKTQENETDYLDTFPQQRAAIVQIARETPLPSQEKNQSLLRSFWDNFKAIFPSSSSSTSPNKDEEQEKRNGKSRHKNQTQGSSNNNKTGSSTQRRTRRTNNKSNYNKNRQGNNDSTQKTKGKRKPENTTSRNKPPQNSEQKTNNASEKSSTSNKNTRGQKERGNNRAATGNSNRNHKSTNTNSNNQPEVESAAKFTPPSEKSNIKQAPKKQEVGKKAQVEKNSAKDKSNLEQKQPSSKRALNDPREIRKQKAQEALKDL